MRSLVRLARECARAIARRPLPVLTLVLAGGLSLVQVGCASRGDAVAISGVEVLEHTPTIGLDVENVRGAVLINVNPKIPAPRVVAYAGTRRGQPAENRSADKWVTASITESDGRAVLAVRSVPYDGVDDLWVQVAIEVPSCDGLRVRNSDGTVDARGVNGAITIENGGAGRPGGYIYVAPGKPTSSPITITSSSGDIELVLPTDSTGNVELISANGKLAAIVAWTGQITNSVIKPGSYTGILNWGTNPIRLKTGEGEVRMHIGPYRFGNPQIRYYNNWWFSSIERTGETARRA